MPASVSLPLPPFFASPVPSSTHLLPSPIRPYTHEQQKKKAETKAPLKPAGKGKTNEAEKKDGKKADGKAGGDAKKTPNLNKKADKALGK